MSLPQPPPRPTAAPGDSGPSPAVIFMQSVWDFIWDPKTSIFCDHPLIQFDKTTKGYSPRLRIPAAKTVQATPQSIAMFQIEERLHNDYFVARKVTDFSNQGHGGVPVVVAEDGNTVNIAKHIPMRRTIVNEIFDGVKLTYHIDGGVDLDNQRSTSDPNNNLQTELCYPRYVTLGEVQASKIYDSVGAIPAFAQCYIYAVNMPNGTGVFVGNDKVIWQEIGPTRVWVAP